MKSRNITYRSFSVFSLFFLAIAGCGGSSGFGPMAKVEGQVLHKGKALDKGEIVFYPDKSKGNEVPLPPTGTIEGGRYALKLKDQVGAPIGWYKVVVISQMPGNPKDPYSVPKSRIDVKYSKVESTPFLIEVKEGAPAGAYDLKLD